MIKNTKNMRRQRQSCWRKEEARKKNPASWLPLFSRLSTQAKLLMKDDSSQIAKLVMDGCSMGIQTLGSSVNQYKNASAQSSSLAKDMIHTEESLMKDMQKFL